MKIVFFVVDESALDCFVARKIIEQTSRQYYVETFQNPLLAFETIQNSEPEQNENIIIILLDLEMPLMNGFAFVEEFEKLPVSIQKQYQIVTLSSSLNKLDIARIVNHNAVNMHLEKPLTKEKLSTVIESVQVR